MTIANYAKQIGITTTKLQYWIRKFNAREAVKDSGMKFIDLSSFGADPDSLKEEASKVKRRNPQITVTLPNGVCVKIY